MLWLIRFTGLLMQAIFLELANIFGLIVFFAAAALGYFRAPLWILPIIAVVSGVAADRYVVLVHFGTIFDKASSASERSAFVIVVYFSITMFGYLLGGLGRRLRSRMNQTESSHRI